MAIIVHDCPTGYIWVGDSLGNGSCQPDPNYVPPNTDPIPTDPTPTPTLPTVEVLEVLNTVEEIQINKHLSNINTLLYAVYSALSNQQITLYQGANMTSSQFLANQQTLLISINTTIGASTNNLITGNLTCSDLFSNNTKLLKNLCESLTNDSPTLQGV